jgi:hypothetical protein
MCERLMILGRISDNQYKCYPYDCIVIMDTFFAELCQTEMPMTYIRTELILSSIQAEINLKDVSPIFTYQ